MTKYYGSPRWSAEVADCSMPMTFDQYSNCSFGCIYCFSQYQRAVGSGKKDYLSKQVKPVNVKRVKRIFTEPGYSQFWPYIQARKVIQWGGLSDPFCGYERAFGVGLELLQFFKSIDYPICFSTKGTWWLEDRRYVDLFRGQKNWNVKISIITLDESKARIVEKGVASPEERLKAISKIAELQCGGATLRLRPFLIGITNPTHVELIRKAGMAGATALSTEFFCLETRSRVLRNAMPTFNRLCGFDMWEFYKRMSAQPGYRRLNRNAKRRFVDEMEEACREVGMRFYISDAHFKERCANGSCCGLPPDWNYSRGQFCEALVIGKREGAVKFSDIAQDMDHLKGFKWGDAEGFNTCSVEKRSSFHSHTMADYMRWLWNNPESGQSPYSMFEGILKPVGKDADGNLIYQYEKNRE